MVGKREAKEKRKKRKKGGACFFVLTGTEVFRRFSIQIMVRQVIVLLSHPINLSYHRLGGQTHVFYFRSV